MKKPKRLRSCSNYAYRNTEGQDSSNRSNTLPDDGSPKAGRRSISSKSEKQFQTIKDLEQDEKMIRSNKVTPTRHSKMRDMVFEDKSSCGASNSNGSINSYQSNSSMTKIKIRRAFDLNSSKSSKLSKNSKKSAKSQFRRRDNSVTSYLSQESLKKIHTFALKTPKQGEKGVKKDKNKANPEAPNKTKAKVYYVEEHVKVLSEIIAQADPILTELAS